MADIGAFDLPFDEAREFFRAKARVPTERWTDLWQEEHGRAFTVAGAMVDDLLKDLQTALQAALDAGETEQDFAAFFRATAARFGWEPRKGVAWRARLVFRTNLSTAYSVGRYRQMREPSMLQVRPFWRYRHGGSRDPRPEHQGWDGLILPADDPWWQTHYPPNGWGCSCYVEPLTARQAEAAGGVSPSPSITWVERQAGGETVRVPEGIDPGWAYHVGESGGRA